MYKSISIALIGMNLSISWGTQAPAPQAAAQEHPPQGHPAPAPGHPTPAAGHPEQAPAAAPAKNAPGPFKTGGDQCVIAGAEKKKKAFPLENFCKGLGVRYYSENIETSPGVNESLEKFCGSTDGYSAGLEKYKEKMAKAHAATKAKVQGRVEAQSKKSAPQQHQGPHPQGQAASQQHVEAQGAPHQGAPNSVH